MARRGTPVVSVVVPTHNRARLLRRAVDSVLRQTFRDFELVIADDASTDGTAEVAASFRDVRVRVVHLPVNEGVAAARNAGIAASAGEFIALLDDDDEWLPDKLRQQVVRFSRSDASVGAQYCGHHEVDEESGRVVATQNPSMRGQIFESMLLQGRLAPTSTWLVRRSCFEQCGGFDSSFAYGEDFDMWLRIARTYEVDCLDAPLVRVFFQSSGLTQNYQAIVAGTERHIGRYEDFFASHRTVYSAQLQRLGTFYCFAGRPDRGRAMFLRAIEQNPRALKNYACLALSLLGSDLFRASYLAKDRLFD